MHRSRRRARSVLTNLGVECGLNYRYLGNYPLSSGVRKLGGGARFGATCANSPTATTLASGRKGFGEWNLDAHYAFRRDECLAGIYNLLDAHANAAEFCMSTA